jgi:hypothetical protein
MVELQKFAAPLDESTCFFSSSHQVDNRYVLAKMKTVLFPIFLKAKKWKRVDFEGASQSGGGGEASSPPAAAQQQQQQQPPQVTRHHHLLADPFASSNRFLVLFWSLTRACSSFLASS